MITDNISSKEDFVKFLKKFHLDYKTNGNNWENNNLDLFLDAMIAYTEDIDGFYRNINKDYLVEKSNWRVFADILCGAAIYE